MNQITTQPELDLILDAGTLDKIEQLVDSDLSILDTETTGFTKKCQVIELSILSSSPTEEPALQYTSLFKPTVKIQYGAKKVHGLGLGQLLGKPKFDATTFYDWFATLEDRILTGWNLAFDHRLIVQTLETHGAFEESQVWTDYYTQNSIDMMDVVKRLTGIGRISQERALKLFNVPMADSNTHRATADCKNLNALVDVLGKIANINN